MKMMNFENFADEICDSFQALCNEIDDIKMFMDPFSTVAFNLIYFYVFLFFSIKFIS